MAFSLNNVTLLGNLGRDAETKYIQSGQAVTTFSVATEHSYKDKSDQWQKISNFTNCVMWGNEKTAQKLVKGSKVAVTGRLQTRSYDDKNGDKKYVTKVIADNVIPLSGYSEAASGGYDGGGEDTPF